MILVIDTNVMLMSLPKISKYRPIFDAFLGGKFQLAITEDVLQEYLEIIGQKTTGEIAQNFGELLIQSDKLPMTSISIF